MCITYLKWWLFSWHDDVIKWKHFLRYWPFVWGIHRWPLNSPHKGQWQGALMFSLICAWINGWVNNREASDLRRHCAHYDVIVMIPFSSVDLIICQCSTHNISSVNADFLSCFNCVGPIGMASLAIVQLYLQIDFSSIWIKIRYFLFRKIKSYADHVVIILITLTKVNDQLFHAANGKFQLN